MSVIQAIILGIVQGIAEFLPISSSGHLVLMHRVFGLQYENLTFDIVVHLGTLLAIMWVFWPDIWMLIKKPCQKMTALLLIASIPVVVAGFFFRNVIENYFRGGIWLGFAFIITGVLLIVADKFTKTTKEEKDITYVDALIIGCMQALALPPGISRSGTTITGGLVRGINRKAAAKFSFLLALIAIAGAGVLESFEVISGGGISDLEWLPLLVGFITSTVVSYLAIKILLKIINAAKLRYFSFYLFVLAAFVLFDAFITQRFF